MATIVNNAEIRVTTTGTAQAKAQLSGITNSITGLVSGMSAMAGAAIAFRTMAQLIKRSYEEAENARLVHNKLVVSLNNSGKAALLSAEGLERNANALMEMSNFDDEDILQGVTTRLLMFKSISVSVFDDAQKAVVNLAARMGGGEGSLDAAARAVGFALERPIEGLSRLKRQWILLLPEQETAIKNLEELGKKEEAQRVLIDALSESVNGMATALQTSGQQAKNNWNNLLETLGRTEEINSAKLVMASFFKSVNEQIGNTANKSLEANIKQAQNAANLGISLRATGTFMLLFAESTVVAFDVVVKAFGGILSSLGKTLDGFGSVVNRIMSGENIWDVFKSIPRGLDDAWKDTFTYSDAALNEYIKKFSTSLDQAATEAANVNAQIRKRMTDAFNAKGGGVGEGEGDLLGTQPAAEGGGATDTTASDNAKAEAERIKKAYEDLMAFIADYRRDDEAKLEVLYKERQAIIIAGTSAETDAARTQQKLALEDLRGWYILEHSKITQSAMASWVADQTAYYEEVKFNDAGYYKWQLEQITIQTKLIAGLTTSQQEELIKIRKASLDAEQAEYLENIKKANETQVKKLSETAQAIKNLGDDIQRNIAEGFGSAFADAIVEGENFFKSMQKLFKDLVKMIIAELAKIAILAAFKALFGVASGDTSVVGGVISAVTGGNKSIGTGFNNGIAPMTPSYMTPTLNTNSIDRRLDRLTQAIENNRPQVYTQVIKGVPFNNAVKQAALEANAL